MEVQVVNYFRLYVFRDASLIEGGSDSGHCLVNVLASESAGGCDFRSFDVVSTKGDGICMFMGVLKESAYKGAKVVVGIHEGWRESEGIEGVISGMLC